MTTCTQLDELLLDGSPIAMEAAARHAGECDGCARKLAEWNEIGDVARSLHETWQSDLLWPRIERSLRQERKRRPPLTRLWQYAAAILLTIGLGGTMWFALREQNAEARFDERILRVEAMDEVERAERTHEQAIAKLERVTASKLDQTESPLMVSYKEKLMLLDDAIAECQSNIDANRQNAHLRKQLLAMYSEKQQTLEDVLQEDPNAVSNR
jgi:hypothetical protein